MDRHFLLRCALGLVAVLWLLSNGSLAQSPAAAGVKPIPFDSPLVPGEAVLFAALNFHEHWNGPEKQLLREVSAAHPIVITNWLPAMEQALGGEFQRAYTIAHDAKSTPVVAVTMLADVDRDQLLAAVSPDGAEREFEGKKYYGGEAQGVYLPDDRTFWIGQNAGIEALLSQPEMAMASHALDKQWAGLAPGVLMIAEVDPATARALGAEGDVGFKLFEPLLAAESWRVEVVAGRGLLLTLRGNFADEAAAKAAQPVVAAGLAALSGYLTMARDNMPGFLMTQKDQFPGAPALAERYQATIVATQAALATPDIRVKGNKLGVRVTIKTEAPATTAVLLTSLMPRPAKQESRPAAAP